MNVQHQQSAHFSIKQLLVLSRFHMQSHPITHGSDCNGATNQTTPPKVVSNQRHRRPNSQLAQEFTISGRGGTEGLAWEKGRLTLQQNVQTTSSSWHRHSTSNCWHQHSRSNTWNQHPIINRHAIKPTWTFAIDSVSGRNKRDAFLRRAGWINELWCRSSQI